jgi:colanic acid/amylovoran biosynthesis glycosyltransferase
VIRILAMPAFEIGDLNPYTRLLYEPLQSLGASVRDLTLGRALRSKCEIVHLHWPEYYIAHPNPIKAVVGSLWLFFLVEWCRMRGAKVVWTVHNLLSHNLRRPRVEKRFWRLLTRRLDGFIALSNSGYEAARQQFPALRALPGFVIPHGHYRGAYPNRVSRAEARAGLGLADGVKVILFFGTISAYKNVPDLVAAFGETEDSEVMLLIAGACDSQNEEMKVRREANRNHRIKLYLNFIRKDEVQRFFLASDLVVLPFREILNSGSAMLALSFDRPVLVAAKGAMSDLQLLIGPEWVRTYEGVLTVNELKGALDWAINQERVKQAPLGDLGWDYLAAKSLEAYGTLLENKEASSGRSMSAEGAPARPVAAIYADPLLAPSMTWVRAQAEALRTFSPVYIGPRSLPIGGLELPHDRVITIHRVTGMRGRVREAPFKVFGFAPVFLRRIRRFEPALVHAHTGPGGVAALPIASYLGVPLMTTFHGGEVTASDSEMAGNKHYSARRYWSRRKQLQSQGALFLAVSKFVHGKLLEQGYPENRTVLHYIGVDTEFFKPDRQVPREPVVLFVGTLHEGKGCEYAIRAMAKVQSLLPDVELVILGDGPLRHALEQLAGEKLRRYRLVGTQPPEVVRSWMNRAKVFAAPSVTADSGWTEALGIVFAEAQAMCLPVVSFASGGIPEAVKHGETGLLATERDWEGLASNILTLLQDGLMRERMARAGRERVSREFNLEVQTRRLENIYGQILGGKSLSQEHALYDGAIA